MGAAVIIASPALVAAQGTGNPITVSAPIAHWSLVLEDVVQIPNSSGQAPRLEFLTAHPTNGLAYVLDQRGPIYSFDPSAAAPTAAEFLDLRDAPIGSLTTGNESGVRGLAFHPDFDNAGADGHRKMYVSFSRSSSSTPVGNPVLFDSPGGTDHYTVLSEFDLDASGAVIAASYRELLRVEQPFGNHNSGHIGFNPTAEPGSADYGKLYMAVGDGGAGDGPFDLSQNTSFAHGKILRIDPTSGATSPYTTPADNPFVGQAGTVEEIWAYGLRNPHKFEWDSVTGEMYISDIGQGVVEEISIGRSGANFGWNQREGGYVFVNGSTVSPLPAGHETDIYTYPVAQYDHSGTNGINGSSAVVSGPVYRGDDIPELTGLYFFGDFATNPGPIFAVDVDDLIERDDLTNINQYARGRLAPYEEVEIRHNGADKDHRQFLRDVNNNQGISRTDIRWGVDAEGEIYVLNKRDGMVRRVAGVVGIDGGDANRDGTVDEADLSGWQGGFGLAGDWSDGNFNAGPVTDGDDFVLWQRNSGGSIPAQSVPEPTTLAIALLLLTATCRRSRPGPAHPGPARIVSI